MEKKSLDKQPAATHSLRHAAGALTAAVVAGLLFLVAGVASAQSTAPASIIEVQAGDTFSGIAARFTGESRSWTKLYNSRLSGLTNPNLILVGMRFELVQGPTGEQYLRVVTDRTSAMATTSPSTPRAAAALSAGSAATVAVPAAIPGVTAASSVPIDDTLVIGVLPNIGAAALMAQYESVKNYFERAAKQKVRIVLPATFKAFLDSTMRGEYDVAVAAPHFARVAQLDRGMVPLVMYQPRINALFLTPVDTTITSILDVRGKTIAFANPQSLVAMYGQQWLRQQGLEAGKDYQVKAANSDMGVGRMLLSGDSVAAIMSNGEFRSLPPDEANRMKIVETFARIPNFIVVAHPRLGSARLAQIKTQLMQFAADKEDGQAFMKATGLTGMVDADAATLRELDPYVGLTRSAMGYGN